MLQAHSKWAAPAQWDAPGCARQCNPSLILQYLGRLPNYRDLIFTQKNHFSQRKSTSPVNYGPSIAVHQSHREQPNEGISRTEYLEKRVNSVPFGWVCIWHTSSCPCLLLTQNTALAKGITVMWFTPEKLMKKGTPCHLPTTTFGYIKHYTAHILLGKLKKLHCFLH